MTETKFTPGPWHQSHRECHDEGYRTQVYPANDPDNTIATLHWHSVKITSGFTTDREANAHLIAAAPELYEALELALDLDENELVDFAKYGLTKDLDITKKYRAALAKARGES
jgi:hypothetical protein